ncbi:MAG: hypothetical protein KDK39_02970 [Leptospiraceae bacterium]|nr:hypothetical protein [Leptospiraceae bacterium]
MVKLSVKTITLLLLILFCLPSCATVFSTSHYKIEVDSRPQGAIVRVERQNAPAIAEFTTPGNFELDWKRDTPIFQNDLRMRISRSGYQEKTVPIRKTIDNATFGNAICLSLGIFPAGFDLVMGTFWRPEQERYFIELESSSGTNSRQSPRTQTVTPTTIKPGYNDTVILKSGVVYQNVKTSINANTIRIYKADGSSISVSKSEVRTLKK